MLIDRGANVNATRQGDKLTSLHIGVLNGLTNIVAILLGQNADANAKARYSDDPAEEPLYLTPLLMAIQRPVNNAEDISRLLLEHGAHVNVALKKWKWTPLHFGVQYGITGLVSLLLEHCANPNAKALYENDITETGEGSRFYRFIRKRF